jgi:hypothetical protein
MQVDVTRPLKLYRYSEHKWLKRSLRLGEFRLRPAADYEHLEADRARQDDELVRVEVSPGSSVRITLLPTGEQITPLGDVTYRSTTGTNYLTLCFSDRWDELLFSDFENADACLVVHEVEEFCERLHAAAETALPGWVGMDAKVTYGGKNPFGAVFSKPVKFVTQHEFRFAWRPPEPLNDLQPITLQIGSIERIALILERPSNAKGGT